MGLLNVVRGLALYEQLSIREIARRTGVSRNTIKLDEVDLAERQPVRPCERGRWSLGTEDIRGPLIPFLRGELEPVGRVVIAPSLLGSVVVFSLSIDGLRDLLVKEVHGHWGYHYHCPDPKRRRSNTLLTFGREPKPLAGEEQAKIVTWERHAEERHLSARAATWDGKKREGV